MVRSAFMWRVALLVGALSLIEAGQLLRERDFKRARDAEQWEEHTLRVLRASALVFSVVKDAETGERGYLLTGKEPFLEPYESAVATRRQAIQNLRWLTADNSGQQARISRLDRLIETKLSELSRTIALRRAKGMDAAIAAVGSDEGKPVMDEIRNVLRDFEEEEYRLLRIRTKAAEAQAVHVNTAFSVGTLVLLFGFLGAVNERAIRNRQRAGEALKESEERFRTLANAIPQLCWTADAAGSIFWYNQRWYEYSGATPQEMERLGWQSFHDPEVLPGVLERWTSSITKGTPFEMVFPLRAADGEFHPFLTRIMPVRDRTGQVVRWFGTATDITEQRKTEQGLRALDGLKTEFFANISHELRTPLTLILGPVEKRLAAGGMNPEERRDLERIERNARLVLRHVNDLLDLSKLDAGHMKAEYAEVDLARMVRRVASHFENVAKDHGVGFAIETPAALAAEVDPPKTERVLLNLLSNAFKFTPAGGTVRIAVRGVGGRAIVEVEDNGPGVPADRREAIFERFSQLESGADRRFGGTGLGLSIARHLVSLHGGSIRAEEPDKRSGSLFRLELPLLAPDTTGVRRTAEEPDLEATRQTVAELKVRKAARQQAGLAPASRAPVVLLVEDNPDMNAFIAETLSSTYQVFCAFDGREGVEKALELRPDLILSDVMMPGMSGDRLVREIRRHVELEDVPIILLTAKADDDLRVKLLQEGAQDYLYKPFDTRTILAKVGRLIADRRRRKETEEALQRLSGNLLQVHDQERKEIAQELHENTVQCLAALQIYLSVARKDSPSPKVQQILDNGYALLEQCASDLRALSYGLHPPLLDNLGLKAAMELHLQNVIMVSGIEGSLDIPRDWGRLPADFELTLFRVLQEVLMNLRCQSVPNKAGMPKASLPRATVRVFRDAFAVGLEVIAKGWSAAGPAAEIGIAAMRERVRRLGGQLSITSEAEATTVRAVLPFPQDAIPRNEAA
jgi:PAS domain S-box-containing protein